jgi:hypothetical protein
LLTEIVHHLVGKHRLSLLAVVETHFSSIFSLMLPVIAASGKWIFEAR